MVEVRTLLTSLGFDTDGALLNLEGVFSRLDALPTNFSVYCEIVKPPYMTGLGVDLRIMRAGQEVWRWGEELIELVPGDALVTLAVDVEGCQTAPGAYSVEVMIDGATSAVRVIYLGSRRKSR